MTAGGRHQAHARQVPDGADDRRLRSRPRAAVAHRRRRSLSVDEGARQRGMGESLRPLSPALLGSAKPLSSVPAPQSWLSDPSQSSAATMRFMSINVPPTIAKFSALFCSVSEMIHDLYKTNLTHCEGIELVHRSVTVL